MMSPKSEMDKEKFHQLIKHAISTGEEAEHIQAIFNAMTFRNGGGNVHCLSFKNLLLQDYLIAIFGAAFVEELYEQVSR